MFSNRYLLATIESSEDNPIAGEETPQQRTIQRTIAADYQPFAPIVVWESACK